MSYIIDVDLNRCVACGACAIACIDQNDIPVCAGRDSFRKIIDLEWTRDGKTQFYALSAGCQHCEDAACITACPTGCLSKDPETGFTVYNKDLCIGCHSCAMACPFGVPSYDAQGKLAKCDGCSDRVKFGYLPACVKGCPYEALTLQTKEAYDSGKKDSSLRAVFQKVLP